MKLHLIQFSQFKVPTWAKGSSCPLIDDIRQEYWLGVKVQLASFARYIRPDKNRLLNRGAILAIYGALIVPVSAPAHTIYADPILSPPNTRMVDTIKMPALTVQEGLEQVYIDKTRPAGTYANLYTPGQCTFGVASRVPIPNDWGNAISWGPSAIAAGYTVSAVPKVGAIAWNTNDSYLGHVALVVSVNGSQVTVWEENYNGPYSVDERIANPGEFNYIYI